ncbi:DUF3093 domain-containing protein [Kribbella sp. NBC_01245]|uniref:DUF3093 domain-containing protein n=1 Tax=Kribbella sp. NBC_01245 TaxID=2903578 RepID=UPI002E2ACE1D|nr:DUF3093 domain-containing protein [Kribbella sp. NBC_01245]
MATPVSYRERLSIPASWWLVTALALATTWMIITVPAGPVAGTVVTLVALGLFLAAYQRYGGTTIQVDAERLAAGRASIERAYLGEVEALTGDAARTATGRDCDARAYLLLRPYLRDVVRVHLNDPRDPAPYWLIATRHPQQLAAALQPGGVVRSP